MKMTRAYRYSFVAAALTILSASLAEGRRYGGSSMIAPRHYHYNRRPLDSFDLVSNIFSVPVYFNSFIRQHDAQMARLSQFVDPRYAVSEHADTGIVELSVELPGVEAKDLSIELENDRFLRIHGSRHYTNQGSSYTSTFDQSFQLDSDVDAENLKATLSAGILRIQVPKKEKVIKQIPIEGSQSEEIDVHKIALTAKKDHPTDTNEISVDDMKANSLTEPAAESKVVEVDGLTISEDEDA